MPNLGLRTSSGSRLLLASLLCSLWLELPVAARDARLDLGAEVDYLAWDRVIFEGSGLMIGPRINVGIGKFGASARVLFGDFDVDYLNSEARRQDWDLAFSYRISKLFTAFITEKRLGYKLEYGSSLQQETFLATGAGLGTSVRLGQSNLFASGLLTLLPYIYCDQDIVYHDQRFITTDHTTGFSADAGIGYALTNLPFSIMLGGRYIRIDAFEHESSRTNTYLGTWLSLMYHL